jgi:hypothetical protein
VTVVKGIPECVAKGRIRGSFRAWLRHPGGEIGAERQRFIADSYMEC